MYVDPRPYNEAFSFGGSPRTCDVLFRVLNLGSEGGRVMMSMQTARRARTGMHTGVRAVRVIASELMCGNVTLPIVNHGRVWPCVAVSGVTLPP